MQKLSLLKKWDNLSPYRKLIFGFLVAIFIGVILLKMPFSLRENQNITVLDSLFTIVSAICVTGLSVVDISQVFTSTGQLIILFFIIYQVKKSFLQRFCIPCYFRVFNFKYSINIVFCHIFIFKQD